MSQRSSYDSNGTKMWNNFTVPALWSKWGENGLDGDGIKYIFTMSSGGVLNAPVFSPNGWNDAWSNRFDSNNGITNNGHMWYDDAFSPTDTITIDQEGNTWTNSDVLCSISKTYTKDSNDIIWWTNWSTPKTWAMYVTNGQPGDKGDTGDKGDDGEGYILSPIKRTWEVQLTQVTNQKYEALSSKVVMGLEYKIAHWKGDNQIENVDLTRTDSWSVKAIVKDSSGTVLKNYTLTKNLSNDNFTLTVSNVLSDITGHDWDDYDYDYRKIISSNNSTAINALPVTLEIQLLDGQTVIDNDIRNLETEGKGLFVTTNSVLQSVYQGVGATDNNQYSNYFSNLQQTMKGFELSAAEAIIGANGAFTTFGSDHLPQTDTEKCFLTSYSSATNWPGNSIKIFDSATPTGAYNNNGTVCYDGSSYWNSSSSKPTLNSSNAYMWMVRGYRTSYLDSNNITQYTSWKVNTPVLYGAYDPDGTIYNNAKLLIDARQIKSSVSTIAADYVTSTQLTQTATNIKAEVTSDISGDLRTTGINIADGTITLNAATTTMNGNFNLRGNFVSENASQMNKITIDSYNGGFKMYGPSGTDGSGNPASGATSRQLMEIGWTEDENFKRFGEVIVNKNTTSNLRPSDSNEVTLNDQGIFIEKDKNEVLLSSSEFSFKEYNNANSDTTQQQINYSWPRMAGFKNVAILEEPSNANELRIAADRDVYICAAKKVVGKTEVALNWNNVTFEMGIVSGQTAITQGMYPGRVITLRLIAGMKLHCASSKIVMKNEAWYGGGAKTVNITSPNSYTFVNYNGTSWIEI